MSDIAADDGFHLTVDLEARLDGRHRSGGTDDELAERLAGLVRRHASEAGLRITDPQSVRVRISRGPASA